MSFGVLNSGGNCQRERERLSNQTILNLFKPSLSSNTLVLYSFLISIYHFIQVKFKI